MRASAKEAGAEPRIPPRAACKKTRVLVDSGGKVAHGGKQDGSMAPQHKTHTLLLTWGSCNPSRPHQHRLQRKSFSLPRQSNRSIALESTGIEEEPPSPPTPSPAPYPSAPDRMDGVGLSSLPMLRPAELRHAIPSDPNPNPYKTYTPRSPLLGRRLQAAKAACRPAALGGSPPASRRCSRSRFRS